MIPMQVMRFVAENGEEILFDEWAEDKEHDSVWVTMCGKCLKKYGHLLGSRADSYGSGCCSVCGCDTPDPYDVRSDDPVYQWASESVYVDFRPEELVFCVI